MHTSLTRWTCCLSLTLALYASGCSQAPVAQNPVSPVNTPAARVSTAVTPGLSVIEAKVGDKMDFRASRTQGAEVSIEAGGKTFSAKVEADRVKVFDAGQQVVAKVKRKDSGFELEDGAGKRVLRAKYKSGGVKVEDAQDQVIVQFSEGADGLKFKDGSKIEKQGDAVVWSDAAGKAKASLSGAGLPVGLVLTLSAQTPEQRAALALYLAEVRP